MFVLNVNISSENCEPGVTRKILSYTKELMMVEVCLEEGAQGYSHNHPHLQITYVAKGKLEFTVGDQVRIVKTGDSIFMPSDVMHGVKAREESILVDVFNPMREEFVN